MVAEVLVVGKFFPSVVEDLEKVFKIRSAQNADEVAAMDDSALANIEGFASFGWARQM